MRKTTKILMSVGALGIFSMSASYAQTDSASDLRKRQQFLEQQNKQILKQLANIKKQQQKVQTTDTPKAMAQAQSAEWNAADLPRRLLAPLNDDTSLTFKGITLYGTIDAGATYLSHGTPLNASFAPGLEYFVSKNSNHTLLSFAPDALSQSFVALKGVEPLFDTVSAVFNAQVSVNPQSGLIPDNIKSVVQQNGVANMYQGSNGDSSRAGQFLTLGYGGLSSPTFGTLTYGRQTSLLLDAIVNYDPMGGSNAFSMIGYSGAWAGGGDSENSRFDNSLKYRVTYGPFRASAMYKFGNSGSANGNAFAAGAGFDYLGFSFDAIGSKVNDAIAASALSTSVTAAGGIGTVLLSQLTGTSGLLNATVSDNTAFMLVGKYQIEKLQIFGGYENIRFANPGVQLATGYTDIGGYTLNSVNNRAYDFNKVLQVLWIGAKYPVLSNLDLTLAYYHELQNSFGGSNASSFLAGTAPASNISTLGCQTSMASNCHGTADAVSGLLSYHVTKRFDVYLGAMWSTVHNGLASGYNPAGVYQASTGQTAAGTIDPTVGARLQF